MKSESPREMPPYLDHEHVPATMGTEFVLRFYRLLKGTTIYDRNNVNIQRHTQDCVQAINPFIRSEGQLFLKIVRRNFFFNNVRIPVKADKYPIFKNFSQEMEKRWIGELEFTSEVSGENLKNFVYILSGLEEENESNYLSVRMQLRAQGIQGISVGKLEFFRDEELYVDSEEQKRYSKEIYFKAIGLVKEIMEGVKSQRLINIRKAKHLMQNAVNSIMQDESALLGLANIKNYDEYTFNHSVNVAIYAIALGQRIGLSKKNLSHLGMAGLLHDIGKTKIPGEILNKEEKLSPQEWVMIQSHPVLGAEIVMRVKEWGELSTRLIDAAFEHHLRYDLTGYPKLARKRNLTLFGKIVSLADFYDALVRPRAYRQFPFVSEKILGFMLEQVGKHFDPALVKVFINMIGIYPLGTLVLLNTNEMGIVVQIQEDPELIDRPKVCLLSYSDGEYQKGKIVDLKEVDEKTGTFKRFIVKTLDTNEYNIHVAEFLI
ncbi:MAG: HD-GYP domain-containing protein [Deltaproteobacteria bacterium]|nr:HD-GYP domain-containing protein [Deltaproteobacteria bacterium]